MTDNIIKLNADDRPHCAALINALEDAIYEIGQGKITPIEILGVLDFLSKKFYHTELSKQKGD